MTLFGNSYIQLVNLETSMKIWVNALFKKVSAQNNNTCYSFNTWNIALQFNFAIVL